MPIALLLAQAAATGAVRSAAEERFKLFGAYSLSDPWFLILVPVAIAAFAWGRTRFGREKGRVGVVSSERPRRSIVQHLLWIPSLLLITSFVLVSIALARPLRGSVELSTESEGVDIALVIDCSGSMEFNDLDPKKSRLTVVKEVVRDFAARRMTDREGAADNVALIQFAHYPKLVCPFTLDVDAIQGFIDDLQPVKNRPAEDGTAIGVGLAKAVSVLKQTDAKSKIVVLLTDGENNVDDITPADAADLAAREKIKVYTIFAGRITYTGNVFLQQETQIDTSTLESIAHKTGGRFFRARDKSELENTYKEIEKLERTKRETKHYSETYDLYPRFLIAGLLCYVLAWISTSTWARRLV